jgi:hypothetical protein
MPEKKTTAREIIEGWKGDGPCDIECRLCGGKVATDPPSTVWIGCVGLGKDFLIDWHEQCDAIEKKFRTEGSAALFNGYLEQAGINAADHERARDVLRLLLERRIL